MYYSMSSIQHKTMNTSPHTTMSDRPTAPHKPERKGKRGAPPPIAFRPISTNVSSGLVDGVPGGGCNVGSIASHTMPSFRPNSNTRIINFRLYVDDEDVGFVIGSGGATLKRIKRQSGSKVKYFKVDAEGNSGSELNGYFNIRGGQYEIHLAQIAIQELVIESKRRNLTDVRKRVDIPN